MQHQAIQLINGRFFIEADAQMVEIPNITGFCLGCHDGTAAPARQASLAKGFDQSSQCRGLPGDHPVETVYPTGSNEYAHPTSLPPKMLLVDGLVTCVSCHDLAREHHPLVVNNRRSALCRTCHRK
jgi:predicted CXXCH cytochrome family protein